MMELREKIARAAALAIAEQDGHDNDGLADDLTTLYLDQGETDFGAVADAILAIPEIAEALRQEPDLPPLTNEQSRDLLDKVQSLPDPPLER